MWDLILMIIFASLFCCAALKLQKKLTMSLKLHEFIYELNQPCVFKNILKKCESSNTACEWTPENLAEQVLKNERLTFRVGRRLEEKGKLT